MGTQLTPVAFDIETTGLGADAKVTVLGVTVPLGTRMCLATAGRACDANRIEARLTERFDTRVSLSCHPTEQGALDAFGGFISETIAAKNQMLVAYNGERWSGGFDLPFLRTRIVRQDLEWPFDGVPYADLLPIFDELFNTTVNGDEYTDLDTVYETLVGDGLTSADPFDDSSAAVAAYESGRFEELLTHNLVDILRTQALANLAQRFCGKSDFKLKSLTPTSRDPALQA